ncbi:MAG: hypothetical protein KDK41_01290 [Leptospiraceae bacterium]|nr:hypothetical protein [Leptospiraceae bacterium]
METTFRICLAIAAIINLLPAILAFLPKKISTSYGVEVPDANYELLLRHRAVLFAIIGGVMVYSFISRTVYDLAAIIGLVSMVSFLILWKLVDGKINSKLLKVVKIDVIGILVLLFGYILFKIQ